MKEMQRKNYNTNYFCYVKGNDIFRTTFAAFKNMKDETPFYFLTICSIKELLLHRKQQS